MRRVGTVLSFPTLLVVLVYASAAIIRRMEKRRSGSAEKRAP